MEHESGKNLAGATQEIKQRATEATKEMRREAEVRAEGLRDSVADAAGQVAQAIQAAADSLRDGQGWLAEPASNVARRIEGLADTARGKSFAEIKADLEHLARRNPALVMGGAVALGFALSRLLKSSTPAMTPSGYGAEYGGSAAQPAERIGQPDYQHQQSGGSGMDHAAVPAPTTAPRPGNGAGGVSH